MCADSDGELGAQRVDPLAARLEHRRDRVLGEPVDLEVRVELAQLVGDRDVALGVPEPDRATRCRGRAACAASERVQVVVDAVMRAPPAATRRTRG